MQSDNFDIRKFDIYREDNRREVKKAKEGLPVSLWETYSAFANCNGGIIILGVAERTDGSWYTTGLNASDTSKLLKQFWDSINNTTKVSVNLLTEKNLNLYEHNGDLIITIAVPAADRTCKPVYINDNLFGGTYRRNFEGDYHCTRDEVLALLRDQSDDISDMKLLTDFSIDELNYDTLHGYRNRHKYMSESHPFERLNDHEYLRSIGAAGVSREDGLLYPTAAGMLMFGNDYDITRAFPNYFLDYREMLDPSIRWTDRVVSSSGDWSGNLCDFFFRVYNKLSQALKVPFKLKGVYRVDDTPIHKAIREALANCIINADYFGKYGIVIKNEPESITFENPGNIRIGKRQMRLGGRSDPRNKSLMKMFNLIHIGEHAGSGVPNIFNVWADQHWPEPIIEEEFNPDRTILRLTLVEAQTVKTSDKKQAIKTSDKKQAIKTSGKKQAIKTSDKITDKTIGRIQDIVRYITERGASRTSDIAAEINLSTGRTRALLKFMSIQGILLEKGSNRNRTYEMNYSD